MEGTVPYRVLSTQAPMHFVTASLGMLTKAAPSRGSPAGLQRSPLRFFNSIFVYRFPLFIPICLEEAKRTHTSRNLLGVVVVVVKGNFRF